MSRQLFCSIAYNVHDSSVSFAFGNQLVLVLEAERVFRVKKKGCNKEEMEYLIRYGLLYLDKKPEDVSQWTMTTLNNPFLTKIDIIDPVTEKPREPYWKELEFMGLKKKVFIINHHLSHAATYLLSSFNHAIIITCDGGGDYDPKIKVGECFAVYRGDKNKIERRELNLGIVVTGKTYGTCASFIYGTERCQGKLMALAALGKVRKGYVDTFEEIYKELETIDYPLGEQLLEKSFPNLKGLASLPNPRTNARDFCASVQKFFVDHRMNDTEKVIKILHHKGDNVVLAGGTGLNLELNTCISDGFPHMRNYIASCCDDTGQSLGALCLLITEVLHVRPIGGLPYLGTGQPICAYSNKTLDYIVSVLLKDGIVLLHNGQSEVGPRALGNRSLIARPDSVFVKRLLSEKIKQRERYRPIAPVVLEEKLHEYFIGPSSSPFMLYKFETRKSTRDKIQGGIHFDNSARVQTVNKDTNPFFYDLIKRFGDTTGSYVLLNTSLNLRGDPIAHTIEDTLHIYNKIPEPKALVFNGYLLRS